MRLRLIFALLVLPVCTRADSLTFSQVEGELNLGATIPLASGVDFELATDLFNAQAAAPYTVFEPDSLQLSVNAVLKAITLYEYPGGPLEITSAAAEPIVWAQANIAIDDRASLSLTPTSYDFGSVPITEPSTVVLLFVGLLSLLAIRIKR